MDNRPKRIFHICLALGLTREDAEEFVQTFHVKQLEGKVKKQPARFFVTDELRRRGHDIRRGEPSYHSFGATMPILSVETDPGKATDLKRELDMLGPVQRSIVILHYLYGFTFEELTFIFGFGEATIRRTISDNTLGE